MIDRSIVLLQDAEVEAKRLKERAFKLAPWLVKEAVADQRPDPLNHDDA